VFNGTPGAIEVVDYTAPTTLRLGASVIGDEPFVLIKDFRIYPALLTGATMQELTG
jgi:hypothetical protein